MAELQFYDVEKFKHGTDTYLGIQGLSIKRRRGKLLPVRKESELNASGKERVGADEFPVTGDIRMNALSSLVTMLALAKATVVFTARLAGAGTKKTVTITNCAYDMSGGTMKRDSKAEFTLTLKSYGTIVIADAA